MAVQAPYLEAVFSRIQREFGSFDHYRREKLGIADSELAALRARLLE